MAQARLARYIRRALAGVACGMLAVPPAPPAEAQTSQQSRWCLSKSESVAPRLRIDTCTAVIQANRQPPHDIYVAHYNRGIAHFRTGQYDLAIADFDHALRLDPASVFALNNRGMAHAKKGDYDRALDDFDQAIALNPKHTIIYNNRGGTYAKRGQWDRAIADFDQALRLDPKDANARKNRKLAEQMKGNAARADADAAKAARTRVPAEQANANIAALDEKNARLSSGAGAARPPKEAATAKDDAPAAQRKVAPRSKSRGAPAIESRSSGRGYAARARRAKPRDPIARFLRRQQQNVRNFFRMVGRR